MHEEPEKYGGGRGSQLVDRYINLFIDTPCTCFWACCGLQFVLVIVSIAGQCMAIKQRDGAYQVYTEKNTEFYLGYHNSKERTDSMSRRLGITNPSAVVNASYGQERRLSRSARRLNNDDQKDFTFFYKTNKAGTGHIFNVANVQKMCQLEKVALTKSRGSPAYIRSPVTYMYSMSHSQSLDGNSWACGALPQATIDAVVNVWWNDIKSLGTTSVYAQFVSPGFVASGATAFTKTVVGVDNPDDDKWQDAIFDKLGTSYGFLSSAYVGDEDRFIKYHAMRVRYSYSDMDESFLIGVDMMISMLAFVFVWIVLYLYTKSFWIAAWTMYQIGFSLPIAGVFYKLVFQIHYFEFLHVLIVYLVLGIGADDVFVVVDTFHHVKQEFSWENGKPMHRDDLHASLKKAWLRSAGAIFNTSLTTSIAFLSSSISPVMPMRTMGWYAALCILTCFILTITFTPATLVLHHRIFEGERCCCPPCSYKEEASKGKFRGSSIAKEASLSRHDLASTDDEVREMRYAEQADGDEEDSKQLNYLEQALNKGYIPFMSTKVGPVKLGSVTAVLIMLGVAIQGIVFMTRLTPPTSEEVWVPDGHMTLKQVQFVSQNYYTPDYDDYAIIRFYFGVKGLNLDEFSTYETEKNKNKGVEYDPAFDLSTTAAQDFVLDICNKLETATCNLKGCDNTGYDSLRMQIQHRTISCFLRDMKQELGGTLPTGSAFIPALKNFRTHGNQAKYSTPAIDANYEQTIGFMGGQLKYAAVSIRSSLPADQPYEQGIDVRKLVDRYWKDWKSSAPHGMGSMKYHAEGAFASYDLSKELMNGFFSGCAISLPSAFLVLLCSTKNIVLALYAVITVGCIVSSVLGFCKSAMDWDFGVGECVAGVIVIGYSVDYVVHLAHMYHEGVHYGLMTRDERCAFAIKNLGTTVFAGAITTAGSGMVMFICYFYFFFKMALLINMTILYAFLYSLLFFMGILWLIGPEGHCGDIPNVFSRGARVMPEQANGSSPDTVKLGVPDDPVINIAHY